MRTLAIDLGLKRCGLAMSDAQGTFIRMLAPISPKNRQELMQTIAALVVEYGEIQVVIGMPDLQNKASAAIVSRAQSLAQTVREELGLRVFLYDESFSSKEGQRNLVASGVKKSQRQAMLDSAAAAVILERFLSRSS